MPSTAILCASLFKKPSVPAPLLSLSDGLSTMQWKVKQIEDITADSLELLFSIHPPPGAAPAAPAAAYSPMFLPPLLLRLLLLRLRRVFPRCCSS